MALLSSFFTAIFVLSALAEIQLSTSHLLEAKISCLDCHVHYDFSGIKVQVKCDLVKKLATADENGIFKVELPSNTPQNCLVKLLGGPNQLYGWKKNMITSVVKGHELNSYTITNPLAFYSSCPSANSHLGAKCGEIASSKTVDLPLPPEWGLAPSSYYVPFFPIIGIP